MPNEARVREIATRVKAAIYAGITVLSHKPQKTETGQWLDPIADEVARAIAALPVQVSGEWKTVPVEPTDEMLESARIGEIGIDQQDAENTTLYQFMLAASPPAPASQVLTEELKRIRISMALLQQNAEGCAINHYKQDFDQQGMPGWLRDTQKDLEALTTILSRLPAAGADCPRCGATIVGKVTLGKQTAASQSTERDRALEEAKRLLGYIKERFPRWEKWPHAVELDAAIRAALTKAGAQ